MKKYTGNIMGLLTTLLSIALVRGLCNSGPHVNSSHLPILTWQLFHFSQLFLLSSIWCNSDYSVVAEHRHILCTFNRKTALRQHAFSNLVCYTQVYTQTSVSSNRRSSMLPLLAMFNVGSRGRRSCCGVLTVADSLSTISYSSLVPAESVDLTLEHSSILPCQQKGREETSE